MRISDWSSDVCSSDLVKQRPERRVGEADVVLVVVPLGEIDGGVGDLAGFGDGRLAIVVRRDLAAPAEPDAAALPEGGAHRDRQATLGPRPRLLEIGRAHSELQSLMRISYAVLY